MVDWFILLIIIIAFILLLISGIYFLVYYQHPDDHNEAWFPKLTVLSGFVLTGVTVLLLPLDVANNDGNFQCDSDSFSSSQCKGLDMNLVWNIIYWAIPIWVLVLIPFMTFYYEADNISLMKGTDHGKNVIQRLWEALKYELGIVGTMAVILGLAYHFLNKTSIPVMTYEEDVNIYKEFFTTIRGNTTSHTTTTILLPTTPYPNIEDTDEATILVPTPNNIDIPVSISTFFGGLMAFIGWWFFALFGGIGLAAMPLDLILIFLHRPKWMSSGEMADAQLIIRNRVNELVDMGELLKLERQEKVLAGNTKERSIFSKGGREEQKSLLNFKKAVYLLEEDTEEFMLCTDQYKRYNPLIPFLSLLFGLCSIILSITWIIQIGVFIFPKNPIHPFLNVYFQWFDTWFPLFGVLSVALYAVYLLLCAVKGCFKFGLRFLFFQIHPMKVGKTYMSSFMFNIGLVLLCALPVVQFCSKAFADYARYTSVHQIMGVQVEYLKIFQWFWTYNIFVIILMTVTVLTGIYLVCRPQKLKGNTREFRDRIQSWKKK